MVPLIFDQGNFDRHNDPHTDHHTVHHMDHLVEGEVVVVVVVAILGSLGQVACSFDGKASLNEGKEVVEEDWDKGHVDSLEKEEEEVAAGLHREDQYHSLEVLDRPPMQQ